MAGRRHLAREVAQRLIGFLADAARTDLSGAGDIVAAVRQHYPHIRVLALPSADDWENVDCSCDGFYENTLLAATIVYRTTVSARRVRFTILHELAHHLLQHDANQLLDDLDAAAGNYGHVQELEELVCHAFAGHLLVPDDLLDRAVRPPVVPDQLVALYEGSNGSWEAAAVRLAECLNGSGAVVIMRDDDRISFCAPASTGDLKWWPRGAGVKPDGPLSRALSIDRQRMKDEEYRWQLSDAAVFHCDTLRIHARLAVAVLAEHPSGKSTFAPPGSRRPSAPDNDYWCLACNGRLAGQWCPICRQRRCVDCDRCGCSPVKSNPMCPACFLMNPRHPGKNVCIDCEADGLG